MDVGLGIHFLFRVGVQVATPLLLGIFQPPTTTSTVALKTGNANKQGVKSNRKEKIIVGTVQLGDGCWVRHSFSI